MLIYSVTGIEPVRQRIRAGYPPRAIDTSRSESTLAELGIVNGDTLNVEQGSDVGVAQPLAGVGAAPTPSQIQQQPAPQGLMAAGTHRHRSLIHVMCVAEQVLRKYTIWQCYCSSNDTGHAATHANCWCVVILRVSCFMLLFLCYTHHLTRLFKHCYEWRLAFMSLILLCSLRFLFFCMRNNCKRPLVLTTNKQQTDMRGFVPVPLADADGTLVRRVVAADNSCLFNSIGYTLEGHHAHAPANCVYVLLCCVVAIRCWWCCFRFSLVVVGRRSCCTELCI